MLGNTYKRNKVLNTSQISALKNGFPRRDETSEGGAKRQWHEKPLAEIANAFSEQIEQTVSVSTVRYYYNQLNNGQDLLVPIVRGKRKKPSIKQVAIDPSHALLIALTKVIWALTRFSIPEIYRLFSNVAAKNGWKLVAIQNFRKIINELGIVGIKTIPSQNLMERHSLRLLLHTIKPTEEPVNTWIVVAAIETLTGYINIRIFKPLDKADSPSLSATNIAEFIEDTKKRLALPIYRVELNGVTSKAMVELVSNLLPAQQVILGKGDNQLAEYSILDDLNTASRFCKFLSDAVNLHNEITCKTKLINARKTIIDEYLLIKKLESRKWSTKKIKLKHPETPIAPLKAFCKENLKTDEAVNKVRLLSLKMLKLEILQLYSPTIPILVSWRIWRPFLQRRNDRDHRINHAANPKDDPIQPQQGSTGPVPIASESTLDTR